MEGGNAAVSPRPYSDGVTDSSPSYQEASVPSEGTPALLQHHQGEDGTRLSMQEASLAGNTAISHPALSQVNFEHQTPPRTSATAVGSHDGDTPPNGLGTEINRRRTGIFSVAGISSL